MVEIVLLLIILQSIKHANKTVKKNLESLKLIENIHLVWFRYWLHMTFLTFRIIYI